MTPGFGNKDSISDVDGFGGLTGIETLLDYVKGKTGSAE